MQITLIRKIAGTSKYAFAALLALPAFARDFAENTQFYEKHFARTQQFYDFTIHSMFDKLHCTTGPAIHNAKFQAWFVHGRLHRTASSATDNTGAAPAIVNKYKLRVLADIISKMSFVYRRISFPRSLVSAARLQYYVDGELHRTHGPAFIEVARHMWFAHGCLHNTRGPAVITPYCAMWFIHGKRHCERGPAIIRGQIDMRTYRIIEIHDCEYYKHDRWMRPRRKKSRVQ